ncbi:MAG: MMPL family transporter [Pseudomonadales bacterium]
MNSTAPNSEPLRSPLLRHRLLLLLPLLLLLLTTALWRLNISYDLAYFLPAPQSPAQQILVERLGQGPGAELIFMTLPGAPIEQVESLASTLRQQPLFASVWPDVESELVQLPEILRRNRLLLADLPEHRDAWERVLQQRLADISSAPEEDILALIAEDPALLATSALTSLELPLDLARLNNPEEPVLVLRSSAPAFDLNAQQHIATLLAATLQQAQLADAQIYGTGQYGVDLQRAVRSESMLFSSLAGLALTALVLWRFRGVLALLSAAAPLLLGATSGLLALSLFGGAVHGITLAFGFTLLGVAVDYPLHLLTHHQLQPGASTAQLWRTLRLGVISTLLAYATFLLSGTAGLMQLGLFASVGIGVAALTTGYLMHDFSAAPSAQHLGQLQQLRSRHLSHGPWLIAFAILLPSLSTFTLFNDDLSALTPVPSETLAADNALRKRLGTVDLRYLVAIREDNEEAVLQATESLAGTVSEAVERGWLDGYQSIAGLLPSQRSQQRRRTNLAEGFSSSGFRQAVAQTAFRLDAFEPFLASVNAEANREDWLSSQSYSSDPNLNDVIASHLYQDNDQWVSLIFLQGLADPQALAGLLATTPRATLVDLKQASVSLVSAYRTRLLGVLTLALLAVSLLLWLRTRNLRRAIWLLGTLLSAVGLATLGKLLVDGPLSLFDLMALALVAGLGLDYALFYSQDNNDRSNGRVTHQAVTICAVSSLLVFSILSLSSIPLLQGIGSTVAIGVASAYALAFLGRYENPTT